MILRAEQPLDLDRIVTLYVSCAVLGLVQLIWQTFKAAIL